MLLKLPCYLSVVYASLSSETGFCGTATLDPARQETGLLQNPPPHPAAPGAARTAAAPGRGRGACAPSRTSSLRCRSCIGSGAAGTPPVRSPNWWTASVPQRLTVPTEIEAQNYSQVRPVGWNLWLDSVLMVSPPLRLRPVWLLTAEGQTAGRSSLTLTWRPRPSTAPSLTPPSATLPSPWRSRHRGSGASTPSATCGARVSPGPASACSPVRRTRRRPPGLLSPRPPRKSPGLPPLPPRSIRRRTAKPERGARAITSAFRCSPSLRRRTGSLWSCASTWAKPQPCWMGWSGARTRGRSSPLLEATASTPTTRGPGLSGDRGAARCQEASVCSPRPSRSPRATASRPLDGPQCCAVWPTRCSRWWIRWKEQRLCGGGGRGGVALSMLCEICMSKISDYYVYCSLLLATAQFFSIFIKLFVDDGGMLAAFSAQAPAASMTHFYATTS